MIKKGEWKTVLARYMKYGNLTREDSRNVITTGPARPAHLGADQSAPSTESRESRRPMRVEYSGYSWPGNLNRPSVGRQGRMGRCVKTPNIIEQG